jgi:hypothetical protein
LKDLQLGRIRPRPAIFSDLLKEFDPWWQGAKTAEEVSRIPVLWVDGRSGEGKSVLLLQLAQRILTDAHPPVLSYLSSADELPDWIEIQRAIQRGQANLGWLPAVAVVDDLHFIGDREEWENALRAATDLMPPRVAVLGCGPTLEREKFESNFASLVDVRSFAIPNLGRLDMEAFGDWFAERTGRRVDLDATDPANRMLVIWIFELLQGESLREFAGNFRRRLVALGLFDVARAILAVNALELSAPLTLFESLPDRQRDAFQGLCSASQLHFERTEAKIEAFDGYRLSHPQIDWQLYREWASPPGTLAQHWGRDLSRSLIATTKNFDWAFANRLIYQLGISPKLSEAVAGGIHTDIGTLDQALSEAYRKQSVGLSLSEAVPQLARWLEVTFKGLAKDLAPDPVQRAVQLTLNNTQRRDLGSAVAAWLWRLSELDEYKNRSDELVVAARSIIFEVPPKPGTGRTLGVIISKSKNREAARQLCKQWLEANPEQTDGNIVIRDWIGAFPQDDESIAAGCRWIEDHSTHQKVYHLLAAVVAARPEDDPVAGIALKWVEDHPTHQHAHELLRALVAARPEDDPVAAIALKWVEDHPTHQQVYHLLAALVAARPADDPVAGIALKWVEDHPTHQQAHELLRALVAARPEDDPVAGIALKWVEDHPTYQQAHELLRALVAARPEDDKVVGAARTWLSNNPNHPHSCELLATLITRSDGSEEWMEKGNEALLKATEATKRTLLVALLAGSKAETHYVELTLGAVSAESDRGNKTFLLASLTRVLANNIQSALQFLAGQSTTEHKLLAAQTLARGLQKYANRAQEFLELAHTAPTDHAGLLLSACIASEVPGEVLNSVLRRWLNDHQRARGYGVVLRALKQYPDRWQALSKFGGLDPGVQIDFRSL